MIKNCLCILLVALLCSCEASKSDLQDELSSKNYENSELESQVAELELYVSNLEDEAEELRNQIEDAEGVIERAKSACLIWDNDTYMVLSILNQY